MVRAISERLASMIRTHTLSQLAAWQMMFFFSLFLFFDVTIFLYSAELLCGLAKDLH